MGNQASNIMASHGQTRRLRCRLLPLLVVVLSAGAAKADGSTGGALQPPCPRLASPPGQSYLQAMPLPPAQVKAKNKLGCLSPADVVYGPNGCPLRYCGANSGEFDLPPAAP